MSDQTASTGPRPTKKNPAPPLRRSWWRRLRKWWEKKRAERAARKAPIPPVEIRHVGEFTNLMLPQSREEAARLVEIIRAEHAREDAEATRG